jgi:hypothetical protein
MEITYYLSLKEYPDKIEGLLKGKRKAIPVTGCGGP